MKKEMNIFEKEQMIKKAEDIKASIIEGAKKVKGMMYRGISLGMALAILSSSTAFGGTHTVDNWEDYKKAIIGDIMKQDRDIKIYYTGEDKLPIKMTEEGYEEVRRLIGEAREEMGPNAENRNIYTHSSGFESEYDASSGENLITSGIYKVKYKTPAGDFQQAVNLATSYLDKHITNDMSDYLKLKIAYDFVIEAYDYGKVSGGTAEQNQKDERNMWLGLNGGPVVCEAYAGLFSKMVEYMGYETMVVHGKIYANSEAGHAWNLVKFGGNWYHVDPTNGDGENNFTSTYEDWRYHDYFLLADKELYYTLDDDQDYPTANTVFNQDIYKPSTKEENEGLANEIRETLETLTSLDEVMDVQRLIHTIRYGKVKAEVQAELDSKVRELEESAGEEPGNKEEELVGDIKALIESLTDLDSVSNVQGLIDTVEDTGARNELQDKLNAKVEELEEAGEPEEPGDKDEGLIKEIKALIESLTDLDSVSNIQDLIDTVEDTGARNELQDKLDAKVDELAEEVEPEEPEEPEVPSEGLLIEDIKALIESLTDLDSVSNVQGLIDKVEDTEAKNELQDKLNTKVDELTEEVEPEEPEPEAPSEDLLIEDIKALIESLTDLDSVSNIQDLIDTVEDTGARNELQDKLDAKVEELEEEEEEPEVPSEDLLIGEIKALIENLTDLDSVSGIRDLIDKVEDTEVRDELQDKLNAKVEELEEEEEEEEEEPEVPSEDLLIEDIKALIENLTDLDSVSSIQDLIDELANTEAKENLQEKLNVKVAELEEDTETEEEGKDIEEGEGEGKEEEGDKEPETPGTEPEQDDKDDKDEEVEKPETPETPEDNGDNGSGEDNTEEPEVPEDNEGSGDNEDDIETPETPEVPEDNENGDAEKPETPERPEVPETPEKPETPETPTPEVPSVPDRPAPERPRPIPTPEREESTVKNEDTNKEINEDKNKEEDEESKLKEEEAKKEKVREETRENIKEINNIIKTLEALNLHINLSINVNGEEIKSDAKPYIQKEEKTFVPIRFVAEALGYDVDWKRDGDGNIMVFLEGDKGVVFTVGADYVFVAGDPVKLDNGAFVKDNRTYVTLEMLLDVLDAKVSFENINNEMKLNIK